MLGRRSCVLWDASLRVRAISTSLPLIHLSSEFEPHKGSHLACDTAFPIKLAIICLSLPFNKKIKFGSAVPPSVTCAGSGNVRERLSLGSLWNHRLYISSPRGCSWRIQAGTYMPSDFKNHRNTHFPCSNCSSISWRYRQLCWMNKNRPGQKERSTNSQNFEDSARNGQYSGCWLIVRLCIPKFYWMEQTRMVKFKLGQFDTARPGPAFPFERRCSQSSSFVWNCKAASLTSSFLLPVLGSDGRNNGMGRRNELSRHLHVSLKRIVSCSLLGMNPSNEISWFHLLSEYRGHAKSLDQLYPSISSTRKQKMASNRRLGNPHRQ